MLTNLLIRSRRSLLEHESKKKVASWYNVKWGNKEQHTQHYLGLCRLQNVLAIVWCNYADTPTRMLGFAINPCKINSAISTGVIYWYHLGYCCFTFAISLSFATWTASFSNSVRLFGESLTNLDAVISETTSVCCISCTAWKPWPSLHIECNHLFIQCEYVCQISVNQHRHSMCMYSIIAGFVLSLQSSRTPIARLISTHLELINSLFCKQIHICAHKVI